MQFLQIIMRSIVVFIFIVLYGISCFAQKSESNGNNSGIEKFSTSQIQHEIFLTGNISKRNLDSESLQNLSKLHEMMDHRSEDQSFIHLGNLLPRSDRDKDSPQYKQLEDQLGPIIQSFRNISKRAWYLPGQNEWFDGKRYSVNGYKSAEKFIEEYSDGKNRFVPGKACGEIEVEEIDDDLVILFIDSQWMMQGDDNSERRKSSCEIDDNFELVTRLEEELGDYKSRHIVIATHHPIFSRGKLGGQYRLLNHLLPVPGLASLITGIRKLAVDEQQMGYPEYEAYRSAMLSVLDNCSNCIFLASHENNLQYTPENSNHFFTIGSGAQSDYTVGKGKNGFALGDSGYGRILLLSDKRLVIELFAFEENGNSEPVFQKIIESKTPDFNIEKAENIQYSNLSMGDSILCVAASNYGKQKFLRGKFYREAWSSEVKVPVLFLDSIFGGLKPVQQGGGFQTKSLRLENPLGQQWVLRSINKDVEKVVPPALRGSFAQKMIQDGIASSHPYGAFAIPALAEAAGIYHTHPRPVFLPFQEALGFYNQGFGEKLYLFEQRPGGNASFFEHFGYPPETMNTLDVIENKQKSHKHIIDQEAVLRARLFDIWIGDWDRHDDQWRWAVFEEGDYSIYKPIPRDRDQVFFKNDGFLDYLASRPYFNPGLRKFDHEIDFLPGLIFNARHFDRSFLNALTRDDFKKIASELQALLNDDVLEEAFKTWPEVIRKLDADIIISKLKTRRTDLVDYAMAFYDYINREVEIHGTDDQNYFSIELLSDASLSVKVYHKEVENEKIVYQRIFDVNDTRELRLFGLEKDDDFVLTGNFNPKIKIRIIGGSGDDKINNKTSLKPYVYDRLKGMDVESGNYRDHIADINGVNSYDRKDWKQPRFWQFPLPSFYTDEGIGLSYNIWWKNFAFRSDPFHSDHRLSLAFYFKNRAFNINYQSVYPNAVGNLDFSLDLNFNGPSFTQFYYGTGNNYQDFEKEFAQFENSGDQSFHFVKGYHLDINTALIKKLNTSSLIRLNPSLEYFNLNETDDMPRYYLLPESGIPSESLQGRLYSALGISFESRRLDNTMLATRGYEINLGADLKYNLMNSDYLNLNFHSRLSAYIPFSPSKKIVFASHLGYEELLGTAEFFHLNYLARPTRLRGYRTNRFAGQSIAYHSSDLRINVLKTRGDLPVQFGFIASFDYGRAWSESVNDETSTWHTSYGGGIFFAPLELIGFRLAYYKAVEEFQLSIGGSLSF